MKFQDLGKGIDKEVSKAKINPYRFWWGVVAVFPLVAYFLDNNFLLLSLSILISVPIVEWLSEFIDDYEGKYGRKSLFHVGIYLDRMNAFPLFVIKVIGLSVMSNWFAEVFARYFWANYSGVIAAYAVLAAMFLYYRHNTKK